MYKGIILGLTRKETDFKEKIESVSKYYEQRKHKIQNFLPQVDITKKLGIKKILLRRGRRIIVT